MSLADKFVKKIYDVDADDGNSIIRFSIAEINRE